jgi:tetratricopeptide (TPR) repeat protein
MKKVLLIFILVLFGGLTLVWTQTAEELLAEGDALYQKMMDMETAKAALSKYHAAVALLDNKYEAYWRISRILYYIGDHSEKKKDKKSYFSQGIYYGKRAIELEPNRPEGHYWLGVNYGKYGEVRGVLKSLSLVKPIKQEMNKVIEIDRSFEDGGADKVLGRVYFKLPGFAGGSKEKSLEHLLKAKEIGPNDPLTRLYLAETYLALDEIDKARQELEFVLSLEDDPRWISDVITCKEEAQKLLQHKKFHRRK